MAIPIIKDPNIECIPILSVKEAAKKHKPRDIDKTPPGQDSLF
jgi:hypothetical protein